MSFISRHIKKFCSLCPGIILFVVLGLFSSVAVGAQDAAALSQGFQTHETNLTTGALVSLDPSSQAYVQLANTTRSSQLIGVIGQKPLIEIKSNNQEIQVVVSGTAPALVSNINGDIKAGDRIAASPIDGVGMKATAASQIIGAAQTDFSNINSVETTINDVTGKPQVIRTGLMPVQINVSYYSPDANKTLLPPFLQQLASNVVGGRQVSAGRIIAAILTLILGFVSIAVLLYSSVRSSIISIGRNPLSETAVRKSLVEVGLTALGVLLVMVIAIYLILRL